MRFQCLLSAGAAVLAGPALAPGIAPRVAIAVPVQAARCPINVTAGHAAPCLADLDGDGRVELLVGQMGDGRLRVYRNEGPAEQPRFERFTWFQAGGTMGKVPAG